MKKFFFYLLFPVILLLQFCAKPSGEFGWYTTQDENIDVLEQELFVVTEYTITRENLYFSPKDTIHYIYKFASNPSSNTDLIFTLEKESLGYVEIEVKKKTVDKEDNSIVDKFVRLSEGNYRLNVVYDQDIIDTVYFTILPDEGYNYKTSTLSDMEDSTEETDEIIKYSK